MSILTWLGVPGDPEKWSQLGFYDGGDGLLVGDVLLSPDSEPSWGFDRIHADAEPLGVWTREKPISVPPHEYMRDSPLHSNYIERIDHVVYAVPELDPAIGALTAVLGEPPRRRAHPRGPGGPEMAFFTVGGGVFIEVVASGQRAALWGIAFLTPHLDVCVERIRAAGGPIGDPKAAVQGGRIASVWKGHVGWGVAVMEPPIDDRVRAHRDQIEQQEVGREQIESEPPTDVSGDDGPVIRIERERR